MRKLHETDLMQLKRLAIFKQAFREAKAGVQFQALEGLIKTPRVRSNAGPKRKRGKGKKARPFFRSRIEA